MSAIGSTSFAALYSTPPSTVFTAASGGFNSVTLGLNSSSSPAPLVDQSSTAFAGYETVTGTSRSVYYYAVGASSPTIVSFTDAAHLQSTSSTSLAEISSTGIVVGNQTRYDTPSASQLGTDVFDSTSGGAPIAIPLPTTVLGGGATYSYTYKSSGTPIGTAYTMNVSSGTTSTSQFNTNAIGTGGIVVGSVTRYLGDATTSTFGPSTTDGTDGFYYNPATGTSTAIGLSGGQYNYVFSFYGDPTAVNHSTTVVGTAGSAAVGFTYLYDPSGNRAGYDGWMYTPSTGTVQIGLTGGAYTYTNTANGYNYELTQIYRTNTAGQIAGKSSLVSATGDPLFNPAVAWLYTPSSTPGVASGFGTSSAGTYVQLGLTTPASGTTLGYSTATVASRANIVFLANNGHVAGTMNRDDSSGNFQGLAAYYYNGSTNVDISPPTSDGIHSAVLGGAVSSSNTVTALNNTGMAAAYATRVAGTATGSASLGQDAYIWDSKTSTRYFVDPVDEATSGYELSYIGVIGDNGVAVGYYNTYSGTSSTVLSSVLFDWSEATGLQTLATYAGSSAASSMAAFVTSFTFGADGTLYGPSTYGTAAPSIVAYSPAPEPASLGLLASGALLLLRRRGRNAR
jgi:hypothetical protein